MSEIRKFRGEYAFLSNFFPATVWYAERVWPTSEHLYQAMKTRDFWARERIRRAQTPGDAKRMGRAVQVIPDWDVLKEHHMRDIVTAKFKQHPELMEKLLATGDALLVEGNTWGDEVWGMVQSEDGNWRGSNLLGKILMQIRAEASGNG